MNFLELYKADMARYQKAGLYVKRFHYYFRKAQTINNNIFKLYYRLRLKIIEDKHGIEISSRLNVKEGLYIGHAYNITVSPECILGKNINLHKGCTIGKENRGGRKGAPVIGDNVYIGINSSIVGHIQVGDDVLIAANSFVNCDIPSHSIVIGNPCRIIKKDNATEGYINNIVKKNNDK